jgi:hypothetical protein
MAGKTNTSATFFAQKKLLGKAHTSNLKTDGEELIGSNIQASTSLIFGEPIPSNPSLNLYTIQSASNGDPGTVEYIPFILTAITGTTYDANNTNPDGGSGQDAGESSQTAGPHAYKFVLPSDYQSNSSNPNKGAGLFNNSKIVHETLGKVQLIPPFFSQNAPNPYIVKIYKDDGSGGVGDEIPLLDNIDWNVDFYNGILFLQDYNASKIPAHAKAFAYVGKMADEVISAGGSGGSGDSGATYIVQTATGSLSAERVLTSGTGIKTQDGGPNGNFTISVDNSIVATLTGSEFSGRVGVTGSLGVNELTGSHTKLLDGSSFIKHAGSITVTSASSGQITVSAPNHVFNEYLGLGTSTGTLFTLNHSPTSATKASIFVNGLLQMPATSITSAPFQDYSITGSNVFFTTASKPEVGSVIMANYLTNETL